MASIKDDRGYSQGFTLSKSTIVRMERRTNLILSEMKVASGTRILEIGCGTGEVSYWMAEWSPAHIVGIDLCVPFIEDARKKYQLPNLRYEVVDFNHPNSLPGERFDYIVGNGILHHLYHNLDEAFASMQRLLNENGKIIFLEPNIYNPYVYAIFSYPRLRILANLEPEEMAFSKRFITERLMRAGFEDTRVDYKDFLLPGIPAFLIAPSILVGAVLENVPGAKHVAQSIFIRAHKSSSATSAQDSLQEAFSSTRRTHFLFLIRYGISGVTGGVIQVLFLYIWITLLGLEETYLLGLSIGFVLALLATFTLQKYWSFRDSESSHIPNQLFSYSVVAVSGLVLNAGLLAGAKVLFEWFALDFFGGWYLIIQVGIMGVVSVFNFGMNFLFTFRHARRQRLWDR